jgi:hypothetical protein
MWLIVRLSVEAIGPMTDSYFTTNWFAIARDGVAVVCMRWGYYDELWANRFSLVFSFLPSLLWCMLQLPYPPPISSFIPRALIVWTSWLIVSIDHPLASSESISSGHQPHTQLTLWLLPINNIHLITGVFDWNTLWPPVIINIVSLLLHCLNAPRLYKNLHFSNTTTTMTTTNNHNYKWQPPLPPPRRTQPSLAPSPPPQLPPPLCHYHQLYNLGSSTTTIRTTPHHSDGQPPEAPPRPQRAQSGLKRLRTAATRHPAVSLPQQPGGLGRCPGLLPQVPRGRGRRGWGHGRHLLQAGPIPAHA